MYRTQVVNLEEMEKLVVGENEQLVAASLQVNHHGVWMWACLIETGMV
jgi:hypothetical protein